ncbi:MAG: sodium/proton-translocating pyrophosphatase, partial [Pirellulaceae bacterium]
QLRALLLPMVLAGVGIFLSLIGINVVKTDEDASQKSLLKALATGINLSTMLVAVAGFVTTWVILGYENLGVAGSICVGLLSGWLIGKWTEYSTSDEFQPTRDLAGQAVTGPATVIISGVADGMKSVWVPVVVVCGATLLAFGFAAHGNFADVSHFALGLYGVGIAAVGMLSTLGITLATDAYGPIADNAGGNAEMAGLDPIVRERTDALDSLGNTTAATGKGFAIGSAALTALALMAAYIEEVRIGFERWADDPKVVASADAEGFHKIGSQFIIQHEPGKEGDEARSGWLVFPDDARKPGWSSIKTAKGPVALNGSIAEIRGEGHKRRTLVLKGDGKGEEADRTLSLISVKSATLPDYARYYDASLLNPKILVGVFLGCMTTFVFCAMTMKAVGRAAQGMVEEVRRQFREKPGIMDGSEMPDYTRPVAISTKSAQKEMIMPSLLGLCMPIAVGMLLGVGGVLGLLVGTLTCGFCLAVFMANAGGAWDNAKKYIEAGNYGGKGSEAHKAGVVGDTVGDPFKDTSGPSLNILIKLMSMVSVVAAGLIVRYSLTAMGIF